MNNTKYIAIGFPILSRDIFKKVLRPLENSCFKPNGGLWSSTYISNIYNISSWYTYLLEENRETALFKDINNACIFTLKENAKIIDIDNFDTLFYLTKKYPSYHHLLNYFQDISEDNLIFDFEKLSKDYDGVHVNPNNPKLFKTKIFNSWCVETLLLFNLDCIKEYQTVKIEADPYSYNTIPYIKEISNPKQIANNSSYYLELDSLAKKLFQKELLINKNANFKDYDNYFETLIMIANKIIYTLSVEEDNLCQKIIEFHSKEGLNIKKESLIRNIVLNLVADYLDSDIERIKTLPKSKIKVPKSYTII